MTTSTLKFRYRAATGIPSPTPDAREERARETRPWALNSVCRNTNRRGFFRQLIGSATWLGACGLTAPGRVLGANERIGIGLIGAGSRGKEIFSVALRCPKVEAVGVADVYTRRLEEARAFQQKL